jgi:glycosyltransferase involved in cell wall biosynthesis
MMGKRICLITPMHLASNPRLVKEADALHEAGFLVRVVAGDTTAEVRPLDATVIDRAPWTTTRVGLGGRPNYLVRRGIQEITRQRFRFGLGGLAVAVRAHSVRTASLSKAAAAEPADLYIAHCLAALPAAAFAAKRNGAKLGFDAEDDHVAELTDEPENQLEIAIRRRIEGHFLPLCQYLTAASPGIAQAYRDRYGLSIQPILNVFPLAQAPSSHITDSRSDALSLYWFSQTIGPGRGLEQLILGLGKMREKATLTIRGSDFLGYSERLKTLAAEVGRPNALEFLPPAPPDEMARLAAHYDVGLASELSTPPNRAICLTNKIFVYLLAGVPVFLSDTAAQRELAIELGEAACLVNLHDPYLVASCLDRWASDRNSLAVARQKAWQLGQTRFNWDSEKRSFLWQVAKSLE